MCKGGMWSSYLTKCNTAHTRKHVPALPLLSPLSRSYFPNTHSVEIHEPAQAVCPISEELKAQCRIQLVIVQLLLLVAGGIGLAATGNIVAIAKATVKKALPTASTPSPPASARERETEGERA
jgi:hypothetical protein